MLILNQQTVISNPLKVLNVLKILTSSYKNIALISPKAIACCITVNEH